jgi:L-ascorbate metabolism protein UlaG (beta-lactamase superfamily)
LLFVVFLSAALFVTSLSQAQNVKITPLGAAPGEFCVGDRALLFEDPTGVRVLIAPGRTVGKDLGGTIHVRGSADERLTGGVHVLLIDHPHVDHIGDVFHANCSGSTTKAFEFPSEGNASEIAARLNSAVLVGGELPDFFTKKLNNMVTLAGTNAPAGCPAAGLDNTMTVPRTSPCVGVIRGGTRTVVMTGQTTGVKITTIPAFHAAGASRLHVDELDSVDPQGGVAIADPGVPEGLTGYAGHETGYILRFTNGLTVLWTGDSGLIGDWEVQSRFYKPNLAVVHGGDLFTMGPDEAAFAVRELMDVQTAIPEHFNQVSTTSGTVNAGTKVERFINQVASSAPGKSASHGHKINVVVPLSGSTFQFDGSGKCVAGPGC